MSCPFFWKDPYDRHRPWQKVEKKVFCMFVRHILSIANVYTM